MIMDRNKKDIHGKVKVERKRVMMAIRQIKYAINIFVAIHNSGDC